MGQNKKEAKERISQTEKKRTEQNRTELVSSSLLFPPLNP